MSGSLSEAQVRARITVKRATDRTSLRLLADEIGVRHTSLADFLNGRSPYGANWVALRAYAEELPPVPISEERALDAAARVAQAKRARDKKAGEQ